MQQHHRLDKAFSPHGFSLLLAGLAMLGPFSIDTYLPSFPDIATALNATQLQVQQTLTAYMVMFAVMILWHGSLSDALGRRRVILFGLGAYVLASLFCAFAVRIEMLWLGRALQGMVGGVGFAVGRAVVRDVYDGPQAQRLMARIALIFAIAPALAPVVGGQLQHMFGWRGVFFFLAALAAVLLWLCWRYLPETLPPAARQTFSPRSLWEGYRSVFSSAEFIWLSLALAANFVGFFVYVLSSPVFIIQHLGLSPQSFGWMFVPMVCGMMLGSYTNGRLAGRLSPRRTILLGYLVMALAALGNVLLNHLTKAQIPFAIAPLFLYVGGMALAMPCLQLLAMDLFPARHGMASSCQGMIQSVVNAVTAGVLAPMLWGSTRTLAWGMAGFLCFGGLIFALALQIHRQRLARARV
ncbi:MAG TPA: multidrug effflux MFS transporter [Macromonas sp.]|nr:multidrug effflux MFS transporter [Macromonas sp.]